MKARVLIESASLGPDDLKVAFEAFDVAPGRKLPGVTLRTPSRAHACASLPKGEPIAQNVTLVSD
jgi:hypothetical protein